MHLEFDSGLNVLYIVIIKVDTWLTDFFPLTWTTIFMYLWSVVWGCSKMLRTLAFVWFVYTLEDGFVSLYSI